MNNKRWKCPYCDKYQILGRQTIEESRVYIHTNLSKYGKIAGWVLTTTCPNPDCKDITISMKLYQIETDNTGRAISRTLLKSWNLLPEGSSKPLPDYIPAPIREDYKQSCRIKDLCPNASATMSTRYDPRLLPNQRNNFGRRNKDT